MHPYVEFRTAIYPRQIIQSTSCLVIGMVRRSVSLRNIFQLDPKTAVVKAAVSRHGT